MTTLQSFIRTFSHHNSKNSKIWKRYKRMLSVPLYISIVEIVHFPYVKRAKQDAKSNIRRIKERGKSAGQTTLLRRTIMYLFSSLRRTQKASEAGREGLFLFLVKRPRPIRWAKQSTHDELFKLRHITTIQKEGREQSKPVMLGQIRS